MFLFNVASWASLDSALNKKIMIVGVYLSNNMTYKRRHDLEGLNNHLVIIDILDKKHTRLINIYRSFYTQDNVTPRDKFKQQLETIRLAMTHETIIVGDFNINFNKKYSIDNIHWHLFEDFDVALSNFGLEQLIEYCVCMIARNGRKQYNKGT